MPIPIIPILGLAGTIIDKVIPDPKARAEAKQKLAELEQQGELKQIGMQLAAILVEAKSNDAWTSRARPSFMYVMYIYILAAIPFGLLFVWKPDAAAAATQGVALWLESIPGEMWTLFGVGYLGYTFNRTKEKLKILDGQESNSLFKKVLG